MRKIEKKEFRYLLKMVLFDIQKECKELKEKLRAEGILVVVLSFELQVKFNLLEVVQKFGLSAFDCLLITNQEGHRQMAQLLGMAVVGCMEGNFEMPKTDILLEAPEEVSVNYLNQIYCHANGLPAVVAETKRCYVRELTKEDIPMLYEILTEEEVAKFLPKKFGTREEELEKLIAYVSYVYSFFEYGYWGIFLKDTNELIGRAGFREGSWPLEVGYVIKYALWGQGLATEVLLELIKYGKEELGCEEILVRIEENNKASLKVAEKCGFCDTKQEEILEHEDGNQTIIKILRLSM